MHPDVLHLRPAPPRPCSVMLDVIGRTGFGVAFNALDDPHAAFPAMMHDAMEEVGALFAVRFMNTVCTFTGLCAMMPLPV
jgi:hypothetical protein